MLRFASTVAFLGIGLLGMASNSLADGCNCPNCQLQRILRQQQQSQAVADRMFGPHYTNWINNPLGQNYTPPNTPVPPTFQYLENNRIRNDMLFGPGSAYNTMMNRILSNMR